MTSQKEAALRLVADIARLKMEIEIEGGMSQEETFGTLNDIIHKAREITGNRFRIFAVLYRVHESSANR